MKPRIKNKKLLLFSVVIVIVLAALTIFITAVSSIYNEAVLMGRYIDSLPKIVADRALRLRGLPQNYYDDCMVRGNLSSFLYSELTDIDEAQRLVVARDEIGTLDVMIVDQAGNILESASKQGRKSQDESMSEADAATLELGEDAYVSKPITTQIIAEAIESDQPFYDANLIKTIAGENLGKSVYPLIYHTPLDEGRNLVVLFDYTTYANTLEKHSSWNSILNRMLSGLEGYAFVIEGEEGFYGHPLDSLSSDEENRLEQEVRASVSQNLSSSSSESFVDANRKFSVVMLLGKLHLMAMLPVDDNGTVAAIAIPTDTFMDSALLCSEALIALAACSLFLFIRFARRCKKQKPLLEDDPKVRATELRKRTYAGLTVICCVTAIVCTMLFMLEGMAMTANNAISQREAIQLDNDYNARQQQSTKGAYCSRYVDHANSVASLLSIHPQLRTHDSLKRLNDIVASEYLMVFGKDGNEITASNSYTGFSVSSKEEDPTHAFQPVLNGYPSVQTETTKNEVNGKYEHSIASLITDANGLSDGFVVLTVNDDEIMDQMESVSLESTIDSFSAHEGEEAAVVDSESGVFTAHTDLAKIGELASDYLDEGVVGHDYEGFTWYDYEYAYVSATHNSNKTTMVIARNESNTPAFIESCILIVLHLFVYAVVFFPFATKAIVAEPDGEPTKKKGIRPILTFVHGYVVYFAALACFARISSSLHNWQGFDFVFDRQWTRGINLFSIWSAVFVFSVTLLGVIVVRGLLERVETRTTGQTRTFVRLLDSLITYTSVILLGAHILSLFGVDTATLLASAGIASIAVGMGAKDLITDILAGLFLIFEGTIRVGDIVEIGRWRGCVTNMGIRTTEITNESNDVMIMSNSRISEVVNMSRAKTLCTEKFEVPKIVDVTELSDLFETYIARVTEQIPQLDDSLAFDGITQVSDKGFEVQLSYSCNETEREALTMQLRTAMQLQIASGVPESDEDDD